MESQGEDGVSVRKKLELVERTTGKRPAALDHMDLPEAASDAWASWLDLHAGRTSNGWGPSPLTWLDIDAWSRMRDRKPGFTELELIRTIDRAFCAQAAKGNK